MNKIEEKVYNKYKKDITRIIKSKYKSMARSEAKAQKFCLKASKDMRKTLEEVAGDLYKTYQPAISEEIKAKLELFLNSEQFKQAVNAELELSKKKLNYKSLKKYQEFEIGINPTLLDNLMTEINSDKSETELSRDEVKYILLCIMYKIIDYLKDGWTIKIGTLMKIWLDQRDIRVNLPDVKNRILEDRLIPKIQLCRTFGYNLFQAINKDNKAIMNYYQQKMERYLMLLKVKTKE